MDLSTVLTVSDELVAAAGRLPTPAAGAAALALALGRVARAADLPLDELLRVVRLSHAAGDPLAALSPLLVRAAG